MNSVFQNVENGRNKAYYLIKSLLLITHRFRVRQDNTKECESNVLIQVMIIPKINDNSLGKLFLRHSFVLSRCT